MIHQPRLIQDEPTAYTMDDAQKAAYRERLRQKLQDPEFRQIEGFPLGEDEDILALSDPPYYTACPNPFLPEIIEQWQAARAELRQKLGLPDDDPHNGYHREPFAADVSEGKNDPIYNAHSYHTKVPHKAIMRYILHYTDPGDIVFDGFCGTGMTGVAAQLCGDRQEVESLGYVVDEAGQIFDPSDRQTPIARLGARKAVLNDLSPAATFIAYNYNTPVDVNAFEREAKRILREVEQELGWMYETWHPASSNSNQLKGKINFTVWSDVYVCPECGEQLIFWDLAVNPEQGRVEQQFNCPFCNTMVDKRTIERKWETKYDYVLDIVVNEAQQVPVLINYSIPGQSGRFEKRPDENDLEILARIRSEILTADFPSNQVPDGYNTRQPRVSHGVTHFHHFYTIRTLKSLSSYFEKARSHPRFSSQLSFVFTSAHQYANRLCRLHVSNYFKKGGGVIDKPLEGTLYLPSISVETNVPYRLKLRSRLTKALRAKKHYGVVTTQSITHIRQIQPNSVDYIFTDPPFGGNIMYSDVNSLWESWLRVSTNNRSEAIINDIQRKNIYEYQLLMERAFESGFKLLKPGKWMTVEFHNSQNRVWNAIQEAITKAGFVIADVRTLDKGKGSFKQVNYSSAVRQDLVISAYKPKANFEQWFLETAGTDDGAWEFVRQHLAQLPVVVTEDSTIETLGERQDYLLFDRMVAFHIQRGASVPLSASEFYAGLRERFVERDGMFFLAEQVPEYDRARLQAQSVAQLTLFVTDEKSSIQWLRQQLAPDLGGYPQTYQDIQPKFLRQLHQLRHEALPELSDILEQNFLQDGSGRWYVPDPNKASDLEKLRQRGLLREFEGYLADKKRLRQFRTEAVRAGFAHAWNQKEYATIVQVAERLPENVLQEDPDLLMYYDNASLLTG